MIIANAVAVKTVANTTQVWRWRNPITNPSVIADASTLNNMNKPRILPLVVCKSNDTVPIKSTTLTAREITVRRPAWPIEIIKIPSTAIIIGTQTVSRFMVWTVQVWWSARFKKIWLPTLNGCSIAIAASDVFFTVMVLPAWLVFNNFTRKDWVVCLTSLLYWSVNRLVCSTLTCVTWPSGVRYQLALWRKTTILVRISKINTSQGHHCFFSTYCFINQIPDDCRQPFEFLWPRNECVASNVLP